jgi:hypothetical protein
VATSASAYLLSVRPGKGVMVGGVQSTEKIRHLSFLQLSGRRPPEHHDFVVVRRHDARIHLPLAVGGLERVPGLLPVRPPPGLRRAGTKASAVGQRGRPMQRDVRLAKSLERFTVSSLDGPEDCQYHISAVTGLHEDLLSG